MPTSLTRIVDFLRGIGLVVEERVLPEDTFLPGIAIDHGRLWFDPQRLAHPADLLHEAGHLAVVPRTERGALTGSLGDDAGFELGAIAWSYAAMVHLGLPLEELFHAEGYRGGSRSLLENFAQHRTIGVPILEWRGLTDFQRPGAATSPTRYPAMKRWLCD